MNESLRQRQRHAQALMRHLAEPLVAGNRLDLLEDGPATFAAMFEAIDNARDHINIESYIVEADGPGQELALRLARKRAEGVCVNLMYDSFGSLSTPAAYFEGLKARGVTLCEYNPVRRWQAWVSAALHRRNHRKLMVVDGHIGFIGGVNISSVYGSGPSRASGAAAHERGWRDLHLRIEGPAVQQLQRLFIDHWQRHAPMGLPGAAYRRPVAPAGPHKLALAASKAGSRRDPFHSALLGAIDHAEQRVQLATAYLVPPRRLVRKLERAAARGVAVDLLLPGVSDSWPALYAGRSHFSRLLRAGVRIYERRDAHLHAKACVIDGVWSSIGSSNIDWRSLLHNAEANVIVLDEAFAQRMEAVLRADMARSQRMTLDEWRGRSLWHRMQERVARRLEFLL
jgi:cardiolipin synthase A/B